MEDPALLECGLVRPSFVPPPPVRRSRNVTRYQTAVTAERTRETQRLEKLRRHRYQPPAVASMSAFMEFPKSEGLSLT